MNRIKTKVLALMAIPTLALTGCGKAEREPLIVYSFSGENEQFAVANGIIVLNGAEEIFTGGNLEVADDFFADITSYSTTFYTMSGKEKNTILSNSVTDMTGGIIHISGDLGQVSGEGLIGRIETEDAGDLKDSLYFELAVTNKKGEENTYLLQMILKKIMKSE